MLVAVTIAAGCGGGTGTAAACALLGRLDDAAAPVEAADVSDPDAFDAALDEAVSGYVAVLDELRAVLPGDLHRELDRLEAAVTQYRFEDAVDARLVLDEFADRECAEPAARDS